MRRWIIAAVLLCWCTALVGPLAAQSASPPAPAAVAATTASPSPPVAVPEPSEKAMRFYRTGHWVWATSLLWALAVPALLLFTGLSARMRDLAAKVTTRYYPQLILYFALYTIVGFVADLPLGYAFGFVRQHAYGLSNQTLAKWTADNLKGLAVGLVGGALVVWIPFFLLRKSPRRWWIWTTVAAAPVMVFALIVSPLLVDPLFNKFGPMQDKALEARILALAERAGIEGSRVFEVEKSVDTNAVNAYVTGLFNSKRIVLWDTLLQKLSPEETLAVMGHEMGHYVLDHVWKSLAIAMLIILFALWAVDRSAHRLILRHSRRFGFTRLDDPAALPLIVLLVGLVTMLIQPLGLAWSRHIEHEADRFALEITHDNHSMATAFVKLQQENLSNPRPGLLYKVWRSTHPPLGERIDFANAYRPWEQGMPERYGERFGAR
jgi:Zn-dependent protease with chaperone function